VSKEFIQDGCYVAIAAASTSFDTVWFLFVTETECSKEATDDYGLKVAEGITYSKGHFLERSSEKKNGQIFKLSKKVAFFFLESVVYPFVTFDVSEKGYFMSNEVYSDILLYIQKSNFSHI